MFCFCFCFKPGWGRGVQQLSLEKRNLAYFATLQYFWSFLFILSYRFGKIIFIFLKTWMAKSVVTPSKFWHLKRRFRKKDLEGFFKIYWNPGQENSLFCRTAEFLVTVVSSNWITVTIPHKWYKLIQFIGWVGHYK